MTFDNFYEKNKESLAVVANVEALRQAWENGYAVATHEMYRLTVDGLRGEKFRKDAAERGSTERLVKMVTCEMCHYVDGIDTYKPCLGYNDIRCPECGSTKNEHNRQFLKMMNKPKPDRAR